MNKYKVAVYAISKNEEKFVNRWYESMKEADAIYVLDTGSEDKTVELLKENGCIVKTKIINPWRFDVARNESLNLVPLDYDICVCTDLDEVFESNWRKKLEKAWKKNTTRLRYTYNWAFDQYQNPSVTFFYEKIHSRKNYKWIYPVHEVLKCSDTENIKTEENIILNHYPDLKKSRSSYLKLLELSIKEDPENERNIHYLGREYMYYKKWNKAIDMLNKHIKIGTWDLEKCASMRFISRCYINLKRPKEAKYWLKEAINLCPNSREPYVEIAFLYLNQKKYLECIINLFKAKSILKNDKIYINEPFCWDYTIDDVLSIALFNLGLKDDAIYYLNKAIKINPLDKRLKNNLEIFLENINNTSN